MDGMDAREAMADISSRCGLSEEIIRRVQKAETEYVIDNLKKGRRVNLPGRGTYRPELKNKLLIGGEMGQIIKPKFDVSSKIEASLEECGNYTKDMIETEEELPEGILTMQLSSLI